MNIKDIEYSSTTGSFPGQETGDFKIPSIIVYNQDGSIRAAGAETRACIDTEDPGFVFVEWLDYAFLHRCR